jgi:hypothetical protein
MAIENQTLRRVIEYAIPKEKVRDAINKIANEYGVVVAKKTGKLMNLDELLRMLQAMKQSEKKAKETKEND